MSSGSSSSDSSPPRKSSGSRASHSNEGGRERSGSILEQAVAAVAVGKPETSSPPPGQEAKTSMPPPAVVAGAAGPSSSGKTPAPHPSVQSVPPLRTPGGSGVYLKLPLRGPRGATSPVRQQPLSSAIVGKTVSKNRMKSQQPLGGDRPIPPLTGGSTLSMLARGDVYGLVSKGSSRSSSNGEDEEGGERAANLSLMYGTDYVFARKCGRFPEELQAYQRLIIKHEIINSSGRRIYFFGQMLNKWKWCRHQFTYHVFDQAGRVAIITKGVQMIPGITASATIYTNDGAMLGTITQDFCDSGYTVKDREGHTKFVIRGPCYGACAPCVFWCFDEHFEVDLEDGVTEIGMVSNNWKKSKAKEGQRSLWGLQFPIGLENRQKALLLGAAFLIHFQFYRRGGNGVWLTILFLLLVGAGVGLWYATDGFGVWDNVNSKIDSTDH